MAFAVVLTLFLLGCGVSLYTPTEINIDKRTPGSLEEMQQGLDLYRHHCGNCHRLHKPEEYDAEGWRENLKKMQKKAKINDEQRELIYKYLVNY